ncbi:MAG: ABC transporter ATP-binding protein [Proteobacteria bacterium]|nr:ABC transporter ATP-binding protein [Pseudomonadota bacterium]
MLEIQGLVKAFGDRRPGTPVLDGLDLEAAAGEFVALIGPSGCGKSTIFNLLAGLIQADAGSLLLEGRAVPHLRGRLAYMQQKDLLLPWRRTLDNAILGLETQGVPKAEARRRARGLLDVFGLSGFEDRWPDELSGGMRQRVALMRTMLCQKEILLLDEPFGALDAMTRAQMQEWLLKVWARFRPTVLLVTHDVEEALVLADRIYVLTSRPARVKEVVRVTDPRPRAMTRPDLVRRKADLLRLLADEITPVAA